MTKFFRLMLTLYPRDFRSSFGSQMESVLDEGSERARSERRTTTYFFATLYDLLRGAILENVAVCNLRVASAVLGVTFCGLLLGWVDSKQSEVQGTVLVLLIATALIGSIWERRSLMLAIVLGLGIPFFNLTQYALGRGSANQPASGLVALVPCLIGVSMGTGVRSLLRNSASMVSANAVAILAGGVLGITDFLVGTPWVAIPSVFLAGVGLGRNLLKWRATAILLGLSVPTGVVVMMASYLHPSRPHFVFIDLRAIPLTLMGGWLGSAFPIPTLVSQSLNGSGLTVTPNSLL